MVFVQAEREGLQGLPKFVYQDLSDEEHILQLFQLIRFTSIW
jgi:hypothetical protein